MSDLANNSDLVPGSPGKSQAAYNFTRRASLALASQVPGTLDEPLFSLFMNGADKMDLTGGFMKGLQIPEEFLQSGLVPDTRRLDGMMMGMDQRQFVQMGLLPDMLGSEFNMVPQLPNGKLHHGFENEHHSKSHSKKRKFQNPPKSDSHPSSASQAPASTSTIDEQLSSSESQLQPPSTPLTPDEERNMKRQRRLVKNREAAQLFRQRQKAYIQDLEKKVGDLSAANNEFRARVELLNSENKLIKEQLHYLRNFITQAVSFNFPKSPNSDDPNAPQPAPGALLGPAPPGLSIPPEALGAMVNIPSAVALGLLGSLNAPSLPPLPSFSTNMASTDTVHTVPQSPSPSNPSPSPNVLIQGNVQQVPIRSPSSVPHVEPHSIKIPLVSSTAASSATNTPKSMVNISLISPGAVPPHITSVPSLNIPAVPAAITTVLNVPAPTDPGAVLIPPPIKPIVSMNAANPIATKSADTSCALSKSGETKAPDTIGASSTCVTSTPVSPIDESKRQTVSQFNEVEEVPTSRNVDSDSTVPEVAVKAPVEKLCARPMAAP